MLVFIALQASLLCTHQLQWVGLLSSCGVQTSHYSGFSCCRAWALELAGFSGCGAQALEHRFNSCGARACCFAESGIFLDQRSNPCLLHWEANSSPLSHLGSPLLKYTLFYIVCLFKYNLEQLRSTFLVHGKRPDLCYHIIQRHRRN